MEKEAFFGGGGDHQLPNCFLNLNWDQSADHAAARFESALSSLVSSPSSNAPPPGASGAAADSVVIRELIGRLGSICNSGEMSPTSRFQSTTTSCYSTPLNSPPKLNLMPPGGGPAVNPMAFAAANPGFAERAARFSCFGGGGIGIGGTRSYGQLGGLSRAASSQSLKTALPTTMDGAQLDQNNDRRSSGGESEEPSTASDRGKASGGASESGGGGGKKRKAAAAPKGKRKEAPLPPAKEEDSGGAKRCKSGEAAETTTMTEAEKEDNDKPVEPPKQDYIHVRARRGQATDSHSLAERVRREKISERMKFLQDLVPGCNKVTGKAVMLDEIINYVQSLQRQVEFLSMKLSTVNPRLEFDVDSLIQKDQIHQPRGPVAPHLAFPMEATSTAGFPYGGQPQMPPLQSLMAGGMEAQSSAGALGTATLRQPLSMQLPNIDSFMGSSSQLGAFWEDDLQSVVQMGFGQNQENVFSSQAYQGSLPTNHMKIEL